jgi:outer membrane protein assembly factor BamB
VLHGDLLIVNCDGADAAFVVALDKHSGKVRWKTWRRQPWSQAYTTPLVIHNGDQEQLVSVGASYAAAYEPQSGKEIWWVSYPGGFSNVPRPVAGHGLVYITTGFNHPSLLAIRPGGTGDVTRSHVAWSLSRGVSLTPSPILVGEELYMVSDAGIATCMEAKTGTILWQHRLDGAFSASPVYADGRIYFQSEQGVTTVLAPGREVKILSVNALDAPTLASMAVASGSVFLRTATHLYRIGGA